MEAKNSYVEELCKSVYQRVKSAVNNEWLSHVCDEIGCKNRAIVIDGNEKLYRYLCAAEKTSVIGNIGQVNSYKLCINNPIRGNKSKQPSKFCITHENGKSGKTTEQMDLRPMTRLFAANLTQTITSNEGCKNNNAIDRFYTRTAGMFYVFRPCGVRLCHSEMYTCESLSDVLLQLIDVFGEKPKQEDLRCIIYDRACDLHPFVRRLAKEGITII